MRWTQQQYREYMARRRKEAEEYGKDHNSSEGISAVVAERAQGQTLVDVAPGEAQGSAGVAPRFTIRFVVHSRRPVDWDNLAIGIKSAQDLLIAIGIIPDDNWKVLQGQIVSEKCNRAEDEGVTIEIETL